MVNAVAPFKTVSVKNNTSEWFHGEIADKIYTRNKLYKRLNLLQKKLYKRLTKLHVDKEIYKEARNTV